MADLDPESSFSTSDVLSYFRKYNLLTRDLLYYWERRGWLQPEKAKRGSKQQGRSYSVQDVERIGVLLKCYRAGYKPEQASNAARTAQMLKTQELTALLRASSVLLKSALPEVPSKSEADLPKAVLGHAGRNLDQVATQAQQALVAEWCGVVLLAKDDPKLLILAASKGDTLVDAKRSAFRIGEGLIGNVVSDACVRLNRRDLARLPATHVHDTSHLASGCRYSIMVVPLRDRREQRIGWIIAENRKGPDGQPGEYPAFDEVDEVVATILANQVVVALELLHLVAASRVLLNELRQSPSLHSFVTQLLWHALPLLRADRGDLLWAEPDGTLKVLAHAGPSDVADGEVLPAPSICHWVYQNRLPRLETDVKASRIQDYRPCCEETRSELTVPLFLRDKCVGVLNLESFRPGDKGGLDEQDQTVLLYLADHAMAAAQALRARHLEGVHAILQRMRASRSRAEVVRHILEEVLQIGFERARVLEYDQRKEAFVCVDSLGLSEPPGVYSGRELVIAGSQYAKMTRDDARTGRFGAQLRVPSRNGPDPNATLFGKKPHLPWAVAPLVINGDLYGYIAADNAISEGPISTSDLEFLDFFSVLAAQAIASMGYVVHES